MPCFSDSGRASQECYDEKKRKELKKQAIKKLSPDEREALGL